MIGRLGSLQFDPLEVTGRNHDLVLAARIDGYRRAWTDALLYDERWLYETYNKGLSLVPTAELPWYRVTWDAFAAGHGARTFAEHADLVDELLDQDPRRGPAGLDRRRAARRHRLVLAARPTRSGPSWRRSPRRASWVWPGATAIAASTTSSSGSSRPALLAERPDEDSQRRHKLLSRYRAHGLLGQRGGQAELWYGTGATAAERYRHRDALDRGRRARAGRGRGRARRPAASWPRRSGRWMRPRPPVRAGSPVRAGVAFLAPLDPFVWDRDLLRSLFDFDYVWEVYVPAAKRRWGYYVLPVLWGDRLVGRIEPRFERTDRTLRILDWWWEAGLRRRSPTRPSLDALAAALVAHQAFGGLERIELPTARGHRALVAMVRARLPTAPRRRPAARARRPVRG